MATSSTSFSFFIVSLFLTHSAQAQPPHLRFCHPLPCGYINEIIFPFSSTSNPKCGLLTIDCNGFEATIKFEKSYAILNIHYFQNELIILDSNLKNMLYPDNHSQIQFDVCNFLYNFTKPTSTSDFLSFRLETPMYTFLKCNRSQHQMPFNHGMERWSKYTCSKDYDLFYQDNKSPHDFSHNCSVIYFPLSQSFLWNSTNLIALLSQGITLSWNISQDCEDCLQGGGFCTQNGSKGNLTCSGLTNKKGRHWIQIKIGISAGIGGFLLSCLIFIIFRQCRNRRLHPASSILLPRVFSSFPYSKPELRKASTLFNTQIFTYRELEEATDNFNPMRKLGCGGFGSVYHGKLRDGRFVAVKRLYENSYKQMEQFRNEIGILSRLRHQNLVTLYGCGSRHSQELLLVYEFIPNGTVADHLHCNRAKPGVLTWPIRLSIAIETADALAYLHNVEIIHRDVKTNNILLDNDFHVKVADFGLSRLFSFEASHVSTAPQGTPGYVDPNYHRYYQLTDKSDVYSFGVVLIELVSSMPAVDVTRHQHEINLANMAVNKIQNDALHELVDPALGFDSNFAVRRMITLVAELAFRCLQDQREVRPSMEEVLQVLREIRREADEVEKIEEGSTTAEDATLLTQAPAASPDTMTDACVSRSSTNDINELYVHSLD